MNTICHELVVTKVIGMPPLWSRMSDLLVKEIGRDERGCITLTGSNLAVRFAFVGPGPWDVTAFFTYSNVVGNGSIALSRTADRARMITFESSEEGDGGSALLIERLPHNDKHQKGDLVNFGKLPTIQLQVIVAEP